jgi:hypothetical protein
MMAKAIEQLPNGQMIGHAALGLRANGTRDTVKQAVHDGDTVVADPEGNLDTRLLGVDAPEASFNLPNQPPKKFFPISSQEWVTFLNDPFAAGLPAFDPPLPPLLVADLQARTGPTCAANHAHHATAATTAHEQFIENDRVQNNETLDSFRFFIAFAGDILDRYGRLLGFFNIDKQAPPRPLSYNERLLAAGAVTPYFIWPNVNPFRRQPTLVEAVPVAGQPITDPSLDRARKSVKDARAAHAGIFETADPLQLLPFELRYLARTTKRGAQDFRPGPDRWVIDLSAGDDKLLPPHQYIEVPLPEDRLFIPSEYTPLFVELGWKKA